MATQNATLTGAWRKIADADDDPVTIQAAGQMEYEVAAMATETNPTVQGHWVFGKEMQVTRASLVDGHIYARLISGDGSSTLVVSGSSESLT